MFDQQTVQLLSKLPIIKDLNGDAARMRLTDAYLELIRLRASGVNNIQNLPQIFEQVQQMANGLEIFCLIEFAREGKLLDSGRAAAFIAAQSLEFLAELPQTDNRIFRHILAGPRVLLYVESGLLYLIAGYYANASTNARRLLPLPESIQNPQDYHEIRQNIARNVLGLLVGLFGLNTEATAQYSTSWPNLPNGNFSQAPSDLSISSEGRLLSQLGTSLHLYLSYLAGGNSANAQDAINLVVNLIATISETSLPNSFARPSAESLVPYHIATLLEIVFNDLKGFSTAHNIIPPPDADVGYQSSVKKWLGAKAKHKYALLWHSTKKWLDEKKNHDVVHSVVSMSTGSGKSFIAEIALVERLHKGWGLYLAPMNALVRQIQHDLRIELQEIGVEKVYRFLTDEHTTLEEEIFTGATTREIVVMTPEKALLAIRLRPDAFKKCSICIFDECHLIAEGDRGAASDDFMARFVAQAPDAHIMLMSAMLKNPKDLADWLQKVTGKISVPITLNWKPTRSLRTLALLSESKVREALRGKNIGTCHIELIGQASIAWEEDNSALFVSSTLPALVGIKGSYKTVQWNNSVNDVSRQIGVALARQHIPTLVFLNTNATHIWKHGRESPRLDWQAPTTSRATSIKEGVKAWLDLAESELGSLSPLRKFHQNGVTVHSGALIDEERRAAEIAYKGGLVGLMIATGTLAQGLNFPSQAVVMAGIEGNQFVGERTPEDILNALGRSGRAGFHNTGLSILVSQKAVCVTDESQFKNLPPKYYELLRKDDACLEVTSALKQKVDQLIASATMLDFSGKMTTQDLETATLILTSSAELENQQRSYFKNSYAAYSASNNTSYVADGINAAQKLVSFFLNLNKCPEWIPTLAQRAGLSVAWLTEMHRAIEESSISLSDLLTARMDFNYSFSVFRRVISKVTPSIMIDKFGKPDADDGHLQLAKLPKKLGGQDLNWSITLDSNSPEWEMQWEKVFQFLYSWTSGTSFTKIAVEFFGLIPEKGPSLFASNFLGMEEFKRSDTSPLHIAIKNVKELSYPFRHISSGFVLLLTKMLQEKKLIEKEEEMPLSVGMLSQAINWGIDSLDKAFWYYSLLPVRCVAHACALAFPIQYENDTQIKSMVNSQAKIIRSSPTSLLFGVKVPNDVEQTLLATVILLQQS